MSTPGSVDASGVLQAGGGGDTPNRRLLGEVLGYFLTDNRHRLETLAGAIERGDHETRQQAAHAIRGSGALLRAEHLCEIAGAIERAAPEADRHSLHAAFLALQDEFNGLIVVLRERHADVWTE